MDTARVSPIDAEPHQRHKRSSEDDQNVVSVVDRMDASEDTDRQGGYSIVGIVLLIFSAIMLLATFPISVWLCIKVVQEYERAVIFRLGRIAKGRAKGPGIFMVIPCTDTFIRVDLRTVSFQIPPQEILTRDSVTIQVDAVVYFRKVNPTMSVTNIENASASTQLLAMTTLRNVLGTKNLSEILTDREEMADNMEAILLTATKPWGIRVERVELKDVRLPPELQRSMAAEAEATREARAKVIAAEGEVNSSRALKEAASVLAEAPAALQLRYLQTLSVIATEKNSTIVFPLPMELIGNLIQRK